jgi:hypothetical protein
LARSDAFGFHPPRLDSPKRGAQNPNLSSLPMNCQYCNNSTVLVGQTNLQLGEIEYHYACRTCQAYFHYRNDQLRRIIIYVITANNKLQFCYDADLINKTAIIYGWTDSIEKAKPVFTLDHIPNWTPANLADKINNLIIFS